MLKVKSKKPFFLFSILQKIPKRLRFVISTAIMAVLMLITTIYFNFYNDWYIMPILLFVSYILTFFSILEGVEKGEWFTLFVMPVLFTLAAYMFYFLFPVRWLTRLPFVAIYAFSFYAILLTSNIFNVGVEKNIQLFRAAFSVNFLYQSVLVFLFIQILISFRLGFLMNGMIAFLLIFPLSLQLFWSVKPEVTVRNQLFVESFLITVLIMQIVMTISFVPLKAPIFSLFVTACYYSLTGIIYHKLDQRLFKQTINEYLFVFVFVLIVCLLTVRW